jgi:RNA polymerase sigma-70 factor (ECF subfamily)
MKTLQEQFTKAYEDHVDVLFRHCLFKINDRELAKDLVQNTFMKTWVYLVEGGQIDSLKAFLFRTLNNLIVDEYRKRKTVSLDALADDGFDPGADESDALFDSMDGRRALALLPKLPDNYREVIFMRYVKELSLEEIAASTGESKNTLSVRIHRGLRKLKELFEHAEAT